MALLPAAMIITIGVLILRRRARVAVELVRIGMRLGERRVGCTCAVPTRR
jgi:hypothetical protein